ncbi:sec-independent protein translocase protein TatA [Kribbella aluminosa]|uniref:Sec-independent protein translocase protein TatA n=1 Tax=Kribbella aluminosa TaxID=416017 RepID=A0ABS4UUP6_9ACTN|nr:twin-arginine translocase TatA/TatE family subunit [Kribbella aluminosa]MBP2355357.1 sec-independent protein translocase protein TatA [Kribbella aluminosa]
MVPELALPEGGEWIVILVIVVLLFGAKKLPELTRNAAKAMKEFEKARQGDDEPPAQVTQTQAPAASQAPTQTQTAAPAQPQATAPSEPQAPTPSPTPSQPEVSAPSAGPVQAEGSGEGEFGGGGSEGSR